MELKDRVRSARKHAELTQGELADRVQKLPGVDSFSQQAITKLESGETRKSAFLPHIAHVCGVDTYWLATGVGRMVSEIFFVAEDDPIAYNNLSEEEAAIVSSYRRLSPHDKARIMDILMSWSQ